MEELGVEGVSLVVEGELPDGGAVGKGKDVDGLLGAIGAVLEDLVNAGGGDLAADLDFDAVVLDGEVGGVGALRDHDAVGGGREGA